MQNEIRQVGMAVVVPANFDQVLQNVGFHVNVHTVLVDEVRENLQLPILITWSDNEVDNLV